MTENSQSPEPPEAPAPQPKSEEEAVADAANLKPKLVYEVIRRKGEAEMVRSTRSLFWSGLAAGILISLSVLGEAIFRTYLPDAPSSYLIENLGYSLGFLAVMLGKMQLLTENTITTVLPVMAAPTRANLARAAHLWLVVLVANVAGAFCVAAMFALTSAIPDILRPAILTLSEHAVGFPPREAFLKAIPAGVIVAAMVWMLAGAENGEVLIIVIFTWMVAAGDFTHIVAGSVEMAYLLWLGQLEVAPALFRFFLPVLAGNIVGGTIIFAMLTHSQVRDELRRRQG